MPTVSESTRVMRRNADARARLIDGEFVPSGGPVRDPVLVPREERLAEARRRVAARTDA